MELGLQIATLPAGSRPGALDQGRLQPGRAFAHACGATLAGTLVILGAEARPGDEVSRRGKAAHIGADLCKDHASRQLSNPGHAGQDGDEWSKGGEGCLDLSFDLGNRMLSRFNLAS